MKTNHRSRHLGAVSVSKAVAKQGEESMFFAFYFAIIGIMMGAAMREK